MWRKVILFFTPAVFGVYLIHVHAIIWVMMKNRFAWIAELALWKMPIALGICVGAIFIGCLFVEKGRIILFERLHVKKGIDRVCSYLDEKYFVNFK